MILALEKGVRNNQSKKKKKKPHTSYLYCFEISSPSSLSDLPTQPLLQRNWSSCAHQPGFALGPTPGYLWHFRKDSGGHLYPKPHRHTCTPRTEHISPVAALLIQQIILNSQLQWQGNKTSRIPFAQLRHLQAEPPEATTALEQSLAKPLWLSIQSVNHSEKQNPKPAY